MSRFSGRRLLGLGATVALLAVAGVVVALTAGDAAATSPCLTGRAYPFGPLPSTREQEKVLDAAFARMLHRPCLVSPGSRDVVDYGIGRLWSRGIDGAGTTIALAESWDDPSIDRQIARYDREGDLPNPQITTIYPSGDHRLPRKCPTTGLGQSCSAGEVELRLDVESAHLIAPYARIVIAVTPADSEAHEDPAAWPER